MTKRASAVCFAVCLLAGCRGDWSNASGTASVDGQRMKKGMVTFHPSAGGPAAYGTIASDGSYFVKTGVETGLTPGDYVVTVTDHTIPDSSKGELAKLLTPEKYATPASSEFKVTVKSGSNSFDFNLKK
jgi:hypothetical protein